MQKNFVIAALLSAVAAVQPAEELNLEEIDTQCKDFMQLDAQSLEELERSSFQNHKKISKENAAILATEHKCMKFVKHHEWNHKVCKACRSIPTKKWRYYKGVWYRWYDNKWHYWGPSKKGFGKTWVWRKGFWYHNGYAYKYVGKKWYRFYNNEWHYYKKLIPINPLPPRNKPNCFYISKLIKHGIPDALKIKKIPRCKVGGAIYLWEGHWKCNNSGGKKVYRKQHQCKKGATKHSWLKKKVCLRGAIIKSGLDVHAHRAAEALRTKKAHAAKVRKAAAAKAAAAKAAAAKKAAAAAKKRPAGNCDSNLKNGATYNYPWWGGKCTVKVQKNGDVWMIAKGQKGKKFEANVRKGKRNNYMFVLPGKQMGKTASKYTVMWDNIGKKKVVCKGRNLLVYHGTKAYKFTRTG